MDFDFELCFRMKCNLMLATQRRAIHSMTLWPRWRCVRRHKVKSTAQIGLLYQPLESRTKKNESRNATVTALLSLKFYNGRMTWKLALQKFLESTNVLMVLYLYSSMIGSLESLLLPVSPLKNWYNYYKESIRLWYNQIVQYSMMKTEFPQDVIAEGTIITKEFHMNSSKNISLYMCIWYMCTFICLFTYVYTWTFHLVKTASCQNRLECWT